MLGEIFSRADALPDSLRHPIGIIGVQRRPDRFDSRGEGVGMAQDNGRVLVGSFGSNADGHTYGFVRNRPGEFQTINFPGHGLVCTGARWINEKGDIVGVYGRNCAGVRQGYLLRQGKFVTIDPPGAVDTQADAINDDGVIVGLYSDRAGVLHGYKATPKDER